ncbi:DUF5362 family protein [Ekhidna sp.]|uniref:DUF5362 family protein n=1 Tax=Ekhidna sp. TaxID=2608089 RepID=UPI003B58DF68
MEETNLVLTESDKTNLLEAVKWGKFLAIIGLIMSGMVVLFGLIMIGGAGGAFDEVYPGIGGGVGFIYILFSLLYIFPSLYLLRFSTQLKRGINSSDQESCSDAYNNLRRLFLFMGVLTIVVLALYALIILFAIMGSVMGGML